MITVASASVGESSVPSPGQELGTEWGLPTQETTFPARTTASQSSGLGRPPASAGVRRVTAPPGAWPVITVETEPGGGTLVGPTTGLPIVVNSPTGAGTVGWAEVRLPAPVAWCALEAEARQAFSTLCPAALDSGEEDLFRERLDSILAAHGTAAVEVLAAQYVQARVPAEGAACFIEWVSVAPDESACVVQDRVLCGALGSPHASVRLAAATGLDWLKSAHAAALVDRAARREESPAARRVMLRVARRLSGLQ